MMFRKFFSGVFQMILNYLQHYLLCVIVVLVTKETASLDLTLNVNRSYSKITVFLPHLTFFAISLDFTMS